MDEGVQTDQNPYSSKDRRMYRADPLKASTDISLHGAGAAPGRPTQVLLDHVRGRRKFLNSNLPFNSAVECNHNAESKKTVIDFDDGSVRGARRRAERMRSVIDGDCRHAELVSLYDKCRNGNNTCLVPLTVERITLQISSGQHLRVAHIGWTRRVPSPRSGARGRETALDGANDAGVAVFVVHRCHSRPALPRQRIAPDRLAVSVSIPRDNVIGLQFHLEASGRSDQKIIKQCLTT